MAPASPTDCIFCKIMEGRIPANRVYEDDRFVCIEDIRPQAKHHYLVMPREHVASLDDAFPEKGAGRAELVGALFEAGTRVARKQGLLPGGFRAVINTNEDGGQTVFHIHLHILGGGPLKGTFG
jgi:histidine triad (HIT) family protein